MAASTQDAKAVVKAYWDHGIKRAIKGEPGALNEYLAPNFVVHTGALNRHGKGEADSHHDMISETVKAIPDLGYKVHRLIAEGDTVVAQWRLYGKHSGHHKHKHHDEHIAPTHDDLEVDGITIYRVENGKIAESWSHDNHIDALVAAGAMQVTPKG